VRASLNVFLGCVTLVILALPAFAVEREPDMTPVVLQPATRYSGGTPIDLSNGLLFNNGTQGAPNTDYEAWAKTQTVVAGLSERPYAFSQKAQFVSVLQEQLIWGESAVRNWEATTNEFPDALAYSKAAVEKMKPELDKLKSASDRASGANEGGWQSAESEARHALIEFRVSYMQMHKNVQARQLTK
jgi:hypothetical protein